MKHAAQDGDLLALAEPEPPKAPKPKRKQEVAKVEPASPAPPLNMLAVIARAAADPAVNPEKMRALLDMSKEIKAEEARIAFTEAFIALQNDLPTISATGRIVIEGKGGKRGQDTPYATFNEIHRVTKPALRKHGFSLRFAPDAAPDGRIIIRGFLDHKQGHQESCAIALPFETGGSKNNVQGAGSSISYAKRYCVVAMLNLVSEAPEDRDRNGAAEEAVVTTITKEQAAALLRQINTSGLALERFCTNYKVKSVEELPAKQFDEASKSVTAFAARVKEKAAKDAAPAIAKATGAPA